MLQRSPVETTLTLQEDGNQLVQVIDRVASGEEHVVVEKRGRPVAAIISVAEYQRFKTEEQKRQRARAERYEDFARFSDAFKDIPEDELERELAKALAEVREEMRLEREAANRA